MKPPPASKELIVKLFDPHTLYYIELFFRLGCIVVAAAILSAAVALLLVVTGILGVYHSLFTMLIVSAILAIVLDRKFPEGR